MNYAIWVTTKCNLSCTYCYEGTKKQNSVLDKNTADKILDYIVKETMNNCEDTIDITYHGGEPFLNFRMIQYLTVYLKEKMPNKKIYFSTTTNGTILNKEILDFITAYNFEISVSIDGRKHTHDAHRVYSNGNGSHRDTIKNAILILKELPETMARMTFNRQTMGDLAENILYLIQNGFKTIVPVQDFCDSDLNDGYSMILKEQIEKAKEFVRLYNVRIGICEPLNIANKKICTGGKNSINIYSDGKIYPCMVGAGLPEFIIGNIYQGINDEKLEQIWGYSKKNIRECFGCSFYEFCDSCRCRIINKVIRGEYDCPSEATCAYNHVLYEINGISY